MLRKLFILILLILLSMSLFTAIGCGSRSTIEIESTSPPPEEITAPATTSPQPPPAEIPWNEARNHIGEQGTVVGPVAGTKWASSSNGQPTFINIGADYPNSNRFTVVIWIQNRGNFSPPPEIMYAGKTIAVTGTIQDYQGTAEIEVASPIQIQTR